MKYRKAPITEAVIDIRVVQRQDLDVGEFAALGIGSDYSETADQYRVTGAINIGAPAAQTIAPVKEGIQFATKSREKLFQAQRQGWSFNKLAPYETWEQFSSEGRALWSRYRGIARPQAITRIALRYVNRLDLPLPFKDFKEYILTVPEVAADLPQQLSGFFMQIHIPQFDLEAVAVLNVAMMPPLSADLCSIALDIDVFRGDNVGQTDDEMWAYLEKLRERKNHIFESCITDAMRRRFE
jgi:uncharacterized protein (TIGR04255 family)